MLEQIEKARTKLSGGLEAKIKVDCLIGERGIDRRLQMDEFVELTSGPLDAVWTLLTKSKNELKQVLLEKELPPFIHSVELNGEVNRLECI